MSSPPRDEAALAAWLLGTGAIRERCAAVLALAEQDRLPGLRVHPDRLPAVVERVAAETRRNYPTLAIPVHGRLGHLDAGGVPRVAALLRALDGEAPAERGRALVDLVVVSVLLDAGSGPSWRYRDPADGAVLARSEGLAVASLRMFEAGAFSSDPYRPLRADAAGLQALDAGALARGLQVSEDNPLVGLEGRLALLHGLGRALERPGLLLDRAAAGASGGRVAAADLLGEVLSSLGRIWPGRLSLAGRDLGDVWALPALGEGTDGWVPFHKLSQWLTFSLFEPLERAGLEVTGPDALTPLAEYRNGGLLLDLGAISLRDPADADRTHPPGSPLIVAWRALTVALVDRLVPDLRAALGRPDLSLGQLLQGGTWSAGRAVAAERRPGGGPPLTLRSDGTVF